jgi:hypothetical protein
MTAIANQAVLSFTVTFHAAFRVGASYASDGVSAAIDPRNPLPADHIKGLMRFAAREMLGAKHPAVGEVFGSPRWPSPWAWASDAPELKPDDITQRHRVCIDPGRHAAAKEALVLGEQAWLPTARFTVSRVGPPDPEGVLTDDEHVLILRCAAAGVHGLGAWRRRGLGWVGVTQDGQSVTSEDITSLLAIRDSQDGGTAR